MTTPNTIVVSLRYLTFDDGTYCAYYFPNPEVPKGQAVRCAIKDQSAEVAEMILNNDCNESIPAYLDYVVDEFEMEDVMSAPTFEAHVLLTTEPQFFPDPKAIIIIGVSCGNNECFLFGEERKRIYRDFIHGKFIDMKEYLGEEQFFRFPLQPMEYDILFKVEEEEEVIEVEDEDEVVEVEDEDEVVEVENEDEVEDKAGGEVEAEGEATREEKKEEEREEVPSPPRTSSRKRKPVYRFEPDVFKRAKRAKH